ncbi:LOW QUALITY PROTEIN: MORC family CW-type zinc finger protein 4 [Tachyglossus aculeatus]|uniref:LOW QUALITY PROTEIN: MORC family CW-type zinc finger protein 4 n=1 Tax=Tachyglossus aculeatus TaxID=9261 RepID=UPI0018F3D74E|nr:LOW QUALITY PROTEIN: MORC family CW-type zinc finger protein 4 [Tachyglossus aculeatus]
MARPGNGTPAGGRLGAMIPRSLHCNYSCHTRPFSAIAELLDNASDPGVSAKLLCIDVVEMKNELCLTFTDNGAGMTPHKLHRMLSFGFMDKVVKKSHAPIEVYGSGFKSGSMRLGKDAVVFTKNGGALSVGLLSQTYLECVQPQAVIVPIVPFNQQNKKMIVTEDSLASLEAVLKHSLFSSEEELLAEFDAIPSKKGTRIFIWNIRRNKDGTPELDFRTDKYDIRISGHGSEEAANAGEKSVPHLEKGRDSVVPETEYSLRAYCSVLYLKPRMQIFLRQKKVNTQLISKSLARVEYDMYKPTFTNERVRITFGFNCKNNNQFGIMMYHNNRLIKSYEKVGCQLKPSAPGDGVGVIGVIECNFLKPAHNKQDFEYTKEYRLTIAALGQKLNAYWREKASLEDSQSSAPARPRMETPDQTWVQCEECLKWRKLPKKVDPTSLPEKWFCCLNPHPRYRNCSVPEEQEPSDEEISPSYDRKARKQEQTPEKRKKSLESERHQTFAASPKSPRMPRMAQSSHVKEEEHDRRPGPPTAPTLLEETKAALLKPDALEPIILPLSRHALKPLPGEPLEKRRRCHKSPPTASPPDLAGPGPHKRERPVDVDQDGEHGQDEPDQGRSVPPRLLPVFPGTVRSSRHLGEVPPEERQGALESLWEESAASELPAEPEDLMPSLIAEEADRHRRGFTAVGPSPEEASKGPFVAVVGVSEVIADGQVPIRLIPFSREERSDRRRTVEGDVNQPHSGELEGGWPQDGDLRLPRAREHQKAEGGEEEQGRAQKLEEPEGAVKLEEPGRAGDLKEPEGAGKLEEPGRAVKVEELGGVAELEQLGRAAEQLKRVLAERDLLQRKVEELEQERGYLQAEHEKTQQEVVILRARETEGLYWSKKHMGYRQAELQVLKAELERTLEEKTELKERLKESQVHLEGLRAAAISRRSPERGDAKSPPHSAVEKLKHLRANVSLLLSSVLPYLELHEIDFDSDQVDEILQTVLETNHILE